jgi:hypothetical protein
MYSNIILSSDSYKYSQSTSTQMALNMCTAVFNPGVGILISVCTSDCKSSY